MPVGIIEIGVVLGSFVLVGLFGRNFFKQMLKTVFGAKKDLEEVKKEFDLEPKKK